VGSNAGSGCAKVAAIATTITAVIAVFVFLTGKPSIPEIFATHPTEQSSNQVIPSPQLAQDISPTSVPTEVLIDTPVPEPSTTPEEPPTLTPLPDTPPGSILQSGETWREGGLELKLTSYDIMKGHSAGGGFLWLHFDLTNSGSTERLVRFGPENFSAVDNQGRRLATGGIAWTFDPYANTTCHTKTVVMKPGDHAQLYINPCDFAGQYDGVGVDFNIGDNSITAITVQATGISSLNNARWSVSINH
jgi:hypothetical protein